MLPTVQALYDKYVYLENAEIESTTFRMQSERSANWANSPSDAVIRHNEEYNPCVFISSKPIFL